MNRNSWLVILGLLVFTAGASWFYVCEIKKACENQQESLESTIGTNINQSLAFQADDHLPMRGKGFEGLKLQLLNELKAGNSLEVIGLYDESEMNYTDSENLGIARAKAVLALFPEVTSSQVNIRSQEEKLKLDDNHFQAVKLNIVFGHVHEQDSTL